MLCSHHVLQEDVIPVLKRELPSGVHFRQIMAYVDDIKEYAARSQQQDQSEPTSTSTPYTDDRIEDLLMQLFFVDYSLIRMAPEVPC